VQQRRELERARSVLFYGSALLGIALSLLGIYVAGFGFINETNLRVGTFTLAAVVLITNTIVGRFGEAPGRRVLWIADVLMLVALGLAMWRYFQIGQALEIGLYSFTTSDIVIGFIGVGVLIELTRRAFGWPLVICCLISLAYAVFGRYLPSIFHHGGFSAEQVLQVVWYSFDGVFGGPLSVVTTLVLIYIVFGVVLEGVGAGPLLIKFALAATGGMRGGPGHAAVASSCLFGTMSGSAVANVVGTGIVTIPMMIRRGFAPHYAGAVETAASVGGQFMPPVMGAVAFIMADMTGIPYLTICLAAFLPALFYYLSLSVSVHIEAVKQGIPVVPKHERPKLTAQDWRMSLCFIVPLAAVMLMLIDGRSAALAGFVAVVATVVLGFLLNPELRAEPSRILSALHQGGIASAQIVAAVAAIGIVLGVINMTGIGLRFANIVLDMAGSSLFIALLLVMVGSLVLGTGLPTVPSYLIIVLVMGSAIEQLGVSTLIVHLFVLYFGVLSDITPPVAMAAFAAASLARADPFAIGVTSCRIAVVGFIVPFVLVYNPALSLVEGFSVPALLWICLRLSAAIWLLSTGLAGYANERIAPPWRIARVAAGLAALVPGIWIESAGFAACCAFIIADAMAARRVLPEAPDGQRHLSS
jgi:TRAP transporter 4TM/12TM fusion protein